MFDNFEQYRNVARFGTDYPTDKIGVITDNVNHPAHYTDWKIECIEYIQDKLTEEEFKGYCKGNVIKYITRERLKN